MKKKDELINAEQLKAIELLNPTDAEMVVLSMSTQEREEAKLNHPDEWTSLLEYIVFRPAKMKRRNDELPDFRAMICMYRAMLDSQSFAKTWTDYHGGKRPKKIELKNIDQWDALERAFYGNWNDRKNVLRHFGFQNQIPTREDFSELLSSKFCNHKKK